MRPIEMEGEIDLPLDVTWRLLHAHLDEATVREIHPWILQGDVESEGDRVEFNGLGLPRERTVNREMRIAGRRSRTMWHYRIEPPTRYEYTIRFENGSEASFENLYSPIPGGTHIETRGRITMKGIPTFLAMVAARRLMNRAEKEDLAYFQRANPKTR